MTAAIVQMSPAEAENWKESTSPSVEIVQLLPEYVSPETMGTFSAGSVGQFFDAVAHPKLGVRTSAKRRTANGRLRIAGKRIGYPLAPGAVFWHANPRFEDEQLVQRRWRGCCPASRAG